jgi:hypothetical protein
MMSRRPQVLNFAAFALLAAAFISITLAWPHLASWSASKPTAAVGVLLGFTIELPFFFWLLILRPRGASPVYSIPVAVIGYAFCRLCEPGKDSELVSLAWIALVPLEVLLLAVLARRAGRLVRFAREMPKSDDVIERLMMAAEREFAASRVAGALAYEIGVLGYAVGAASPVLVRPDDAAFSYHRRSGLRLIYGVALVIGLFEIVGLHLWIAAYSHIGAWLLSAFEIYGAIWVVGLVRSVERLPVVLGPVGLHVRLGVIYSVFVPYDAIESVQTRALHGHTTSREKYLNCAFMNAPDCVLQLQRPLRVRLPYTLSRTVDRIGLMVDEPRRFLSSLESRLSD